MNKTNISCALLCAALLGVPEVPAQDAVSINLRQAVEMALRNSREVGLAQARYNVAQNTVEVNRSAFRPNLYGLGSGQHARISANAQWSSSFDRQRVVSSNGFQS